MTRENPDAPTWSVGFNARLNDIGQRFNIWPLDTELGAQWNFGWLRADTEIRAKLNSRGK